MLRFEKALYDNPDQDLNKLWWDLVEKYQMVQRPEGRNAPDYASKIHIVSAPVYYHNYMMGELFASQVQHAIARDVLERSRSGQGELRRQQGGRRVHQDASLRPRPLARLERPDQARHRRRLERQGVRRRDRPGVTASLVSANSRAIVTRSTSKTLEMGRLLTAADTRALACAF